MTDLLQPITGFIPSSEFGQRVVGPPGATLTPEQKAISRNDPLSFRFVAGRKARCSREEVLAWIDDCSKRGVLNPIGSSVVVYRQDRRDSSATGILGDLSLDAYLEGRVKRHEKTIAKTQRKMADYMRTTRIYGNPAVMAMRSGLGDVIDPHTQRAPDSTFKTIDGISHSLWVVDGSDAEQLCGHVESDLYITDGHHRLAAAAAVAAEEKRTDARLPAGVFSADEFRLRSFARCIYDPGLDGQTAVASLSTEFELEEVAPEEARPRSQFELGAKVGEHYYRFEIPDELIPADPAHALNTSLLQELILEPIFGIEKPRLDTRLRFVADLGDIHETCADADVWLLPFPLTATDVMSVADSDRTMPPKSTWFAPKLPSGLVIRPIA